MKRTMFKFLIGLTLGASLSFAIAGTADGPSDRIPKGVNTIRTIPIDIVASGILQAGKTPSGKAHTINVDEEGNVICAKPMRSRWLQR